MIDSLTAGFYCPRLLTKKEQKENMAGNVVRLIETFNKSIVPKRRGNEQSYQSRNARYR